MLRHRQQGATAVRGPDPDLPLPSSDIAAIRAAERALAEAFETPDRTPWVDFCTDDAIFVSSGEKVIEGRESLLAAAREMVLPSAEIVGESPPSAMVISP